MNTPPFYIDPSIIAGLILGDLDLEDLLPFLREPASLAYSDFGLGEVVSAISALVRARRARGVHAAAIMLGVPATSTLQSR